jgi:hypothetical protein
MTDLRPHRLWLGLLALAIALLVGSGPALRYAQDIAAHHLAELRAKSAQASQNLHQLEDDVATARRISGQIDNATATEVLAPVDRLQAAALLEREAAAAHLQHFTYTLDPEQRFATESDGFKQDLATSDIAVAADVSLDTDGIAFIEHIGHSLPGRVRVKELSFERIGGANAAPATVNLRFKATLEWLSNGTRTVMAGAP